MNYSSTERTALSLLTLSSHHRGVLNRVNIRRIIDDDDSSAEAATVGLQQRDENILLSRGTADPFNLPVTQLEDPFDAQLGRTTHSIVSKRNTRTTTSRHQRRVTSNLRERSTDLYRHTAFTHEMNNEEENSPQSEMLSQKQQEAEDLKIFHQTIIRNAMKALDDL